MQSREVARDVSLVTGLLSHVGLVFHVKLACHDIKVLLFSITAIEILS